MIYTVLAIETITSLAFVFHLKGRKTFTNEAFLKTCSNQFLKYEVIPQKVKLYGHFGLNTAKKHGAETDEQ